MCDMHATYIQSTILSHMNIYYHILSHTITYHNIEHAYRIMWIAVTVLSKVLVATDFHYCTQRRLSFPKPEVFARLCLSVTVATLITSGHQVLWAQFLVSTMFYSFTCRDTVSVIALVPQPCRSCICLSWLKLCSLYSLCRSRHLGWIFIQIQSAHWRPVCSRWKAASGERATQLH